MASWKTPKSISGQPDGRSYQLDDTKLSSDQKVALNLTLVKLRGMAYQKMKLLK